MGKGFTFNQISLIILVLIVSVGLLIFLITNFEQIRGVVFSLLNIVTNSVEVIDIGEIS